MLFFICTLYSMHFLRDSFFFATFGFSVTLNALFHVISFTENERKRVKVGRKKIALSFNHHHTTAATMTKIKVTAGQTTCMCFSPIFALYFNFIFLFLLFFVLSFFSSFKPWRSTLACICMNIHMKQQTVSKRICVCCLNWNFANKCRLWETKASWNKNEKH